MDNLQKVGKIEAIGLVLAIISNNIIFNLTSIIFNGSASGAWVNVLYISVISLIFMFIVLALFKNFPNSDLLDLSKFLGGKTLKYIITILYVVLFMSITAVYIRYYVNDLHVVYYSGYNFLILALFAIVPAIISSRIGLKAIYGTNLVVIPITLLSIILLFSTSIRDFSWQRLFPALGYGAKNLFINQSMNLFAFNIIGYLYFLPPFLKDVKDFKKISIFSIIVCGLYYLLTILALTMTFAYSFQADEAFSLYLIARAATLGRFFQRIDAMFFFIWILTILSFLSFNIYLISAIIKKGFSLGESKELIFSISAILIGFALAFKNIAAVSVFMRGFCKYYTVILIFGISLVVALFANIKRKRSLR